MRRRIEGAPLPGASDAALARALENRLRAAFDEHLVAAEGRVYVYTGDVWREIPERWLRLEVATYDGQPFERTANNSTVSGDIAINEARCRGAAQLLVDRIAVDDFFDDAAEGIAFRNGFVTFDPQTGAPRLEPHRPDHRRRTLVPLNWRGTALAPGELAGTAHLSRLFEGFRGAPDETDRVALLQEICAVALLGMATKLAQPRMPILIGPPNAGKSTLLELISQVCNPAGGVVSVKPGDWSEPYHLARLAGATINLIDELPAFRAIRSDVFKTVVTGQIVSAREPFKTVFEFRPVAINIVSSNTEPRFDEKGLPPAVQRRLLPLRFERGVGAGQADPDLKTKVLAHDGETLAAWIVEGASRIVRTRDFTVPASSRKVLGEWVEDADPFEVWFQANCARDPKVKPEPTADALATYHKYLIDECGYQRQHLPTIRTFNAALREKGAAIGPYGSRRCVKGIRFRCPLIDAKTGITRPETEFADAAGDEDRPF